MPAGNGLVAEDLVGESSHHYLLLAPFEKERGLLVLESKVALGQLHLQPSLSHSQEGFVPYLQPRGGHPQAAAVLAQQVFQEGFPHRLGILPDLPDNVLGQVPVPRAEKKGDQVLFKPRAKLLETQHALDTADRAVPEPQLAARIPADKQGLCGRGPHLLDATLGLHLYGQFHNTSLGQPAFAQNPLLAVLPEHGPVVLLDLDQMSKEALHEAFFLASPHAIHLQHPLPQLLSEPLPDTSLLLLQPLPILPPALPPTLLLAFLVALSQLALLGGLGHASS
jgi:hypothetical protein